MRLKVNSWSREFLNFFTSAIFMFLNVIIKNMNMAISLVSHIKIVISQKYVYKSWKKWYYKQRYYKNKKIEKQKKINNIK